MVLAKLVIHTLELVTIKFNVWYLNVHEEKLLLWLDNVKHVSHTQVQILFSRLA